MRKPLPYYIPYAIALAFPIATVVAGIVTGNWMESMGTCFMICFSTLLLLGFAEP